VTPLDFSVFRFLAIDDMSSHRDLLKGMLWQAGVRSIDLACDGADAVNKISKNEYDVILCDYNLGEGQDGQQVLEEVMHRKLLSYNTIYVMITAENSSNMVRGAMEYSPDDYLIKPISKEILGHRVQRLLEKKQAMRGIYDATEAKQYAEAIVMCDDVIAKHKRLRQDLMKLKAELYCKSNNPVEARKVYQEAYDKKQYQWANLGLGRVSLQLKEYPQARKLFKTLMVENPDCLEAYDCLALAFEGEGDTKEAQRILGLAAKISPKALLRQRELGRVSLINDDADAAIAAFKQSIKLARHSVFHSIEDYFGLVRAQLYKNDFSSAIAALTNAKNDFKRDAKSGIRIEIMQCEIDFNCDRQDKAKLNWDSVKRMASAYKEPMTADLSEDLIRAAKLFQDNEIAEIAGLDSAVVKKQVSSESKRYKKLNKEGIKLYSGGYLQEAIEKFEEALKGMPDNTGVLLNYIQVLIAEAKELGLDADEDKKIRRMLKKAKSIEPESERCLSLIKAFNSLNKG